MNQSQVHISMQTQDQQLGYDILGRLFIAAENYYLKCKDESYNHQNALYSSYDIFHNANKKSKDAVRSELINQINIFQASNQYFLQKYKTGLIPQNFDESINDIKKWKNSMTNPKDKELYDGILKVLNNNSINTDYFSNQNNVQNKNSKKGRQEFWANMGTHASASTQQRINEINSNPNYKPTFQRGNNFNPNFNNNSNYNEISVLSEQANNILNQINQLIEFYYNSLKSNNFTNAQNNINQIKVKIDDLEKIITKIEKKNGTYLFPNSIIDKETFLQNLEYLISIETNKTNKNVLIKLNQLFNENL